jgi:HK97 family phage major capsid protein
MLFEKLRAEFNALHKTSADVFAAAEAEGRPLTDEERTAHDTRFARMETLKRTMDDHGKFAAMQLAAGNAQTPATPPGQTEAQAEAERQGFTAPKTPATDAERRQQFSQAFNHYVRTGETRTAKFTLTTSTGSEVMMPVSVGMPIVLKRLMNPIRAALMARGRMPITTDGMETLKIPIFDDSANTADVIAQTSTSDNPKDPSLSGLTLGADLYDSGTIWSSNTLLQSTGFDLLSYLEPMLDERIDRAQLTAWFALLVAATVGKTTAATNNITYPELLDWQHSIPLARRRNGVFFVSDGLQRALRGLVDDNGQPLYQTSLRDDAPDLLLGWPVFVTDGLATPAAGAVSGVAASTDGLIVRDVRGGTTGGKRVKRYEESTHADQFGIREFSNGDFKFVPSTVRTLKHAAS